MLQCLFDKFFCALKSAFDYDVNKPFSYIFSSFLFIALLTTCFGGYFCYSYPFFRILEITLVFSLIAWITSFFFFICSDSFMVHICSNRNYFLISLFKTIISTPIELISEFSRPIALTVRLTANVIVGHLLTQAVYLLVVYISGWFVFLRFFLILIECFVFVIQSYIFTRLIYLYMNE